MIENENKGFTNISIFLVAKYGINDHDHRKEINVLVNLSSLFYIVVFNIMKLLALLQVKAGKSMI